MEDLMEVCAMRDEIKKTLEDMSNNFLLHLTEILQGNTDAPPIELEPLLADGITPQQTMKRLKRLSKVRETEESDNNSGITETSKRMSNLNLLAKADAISEMEDNHVEIPTATVTTNETVEKNEPIPVRVVRSKSVPEAPQPKASLTQSASTINVLENTSEDSTVFVRPQRQLRVKAEMNFKEPKLNSKLRRPSNLDEVNLTVNVKKEHETRQSQIIEMKKSQLHNSVSSENSVLVLPSSEPVVLNLLSDEETTEPEPEPVRVPEPEPEPQLEPKSVTKTDKQLRIVVKREKSSLEYKEVINSSDNKAIEKTQSSAKPNETTISSNVSSAASSTVNAGNAKKKDGKKKKHRPIKVERLSEIDKPSAAKVVVTNEQPIANARSASVYEDARDDMPLISKEKTTHTRDHLADETVTISGKATMAASDATFSTNTDAADVVNATFQMDDAHNPNVTLTKTQQLNNADATFNMVPCETQRTSLASSHHSMATAKDNISPNVLDDSLITDDETETESPVPTTTAIKNSKSYNGSNKPIKTIANKISKSVTRTKELFNPLVQSPVKMKVKAFENVKNAAYENEKSKILRSKNTKENMPTTTTSGSNSNTPLAGKFHTMTLGRFLTPTQASNLTPNSMLNLNQAKKAPISASKAMTLPKSMAGKLRSASSTKTLTRENSAEEMRKFTEERKKQREQKHFLAAQQREAKERERAERIAKFAKEREEKLLLKKQAEAESRKQEEMQRKLRAQQEAAELEAKKKAAKLKAIAEQEREMLQQINTPSAKARGVMAPPPPPKTPNKYTFEMLHEDDSTDDESKVSYKRPPVPSWSKPENRVSTILMQQHFPINVIDHFFSVMPRTLDLREIFPNIDKKHLKRNSSALWSTPPRYSELPKY